MSNQFDLSPLEADVLGVIRRVGLQVQLWFPVVKRGVLDIRSNASDEQVHAAVVALARKHAISDVENGCLEPPNWVATAEGPEAAAETGHDLPPITRENLQTDSQGLHLSLLEAQIIQAVNHTGWYAYLWFPKVQRGLLNFGLPDPEEKVHSALVGLTRRGLLVVREELDEYPEWNPTTAALEAAANLEFPSQLP